MTISSLEEYISELQKIINKIGKSYATLYRGQRNCVWQIKSSLERHGVEKISCQDFYSTIDRYKPLLNPISDSKFSRKFTRAGYPFDFKEYEKGSWELPEMEYLTYLRHHGFPTPLIDWSSSSYIALFFACEDFIDSKTNGKVFIYSKPTVWIGGNDIPDLRHIGKYVEAGKRHFAQQSEYLIPTVYNNKWEFITFQEAISDKSNPHQLYEIEIENSSKRELMLELHKMNINRYTMYLDEDSLIRTFADEWGLSLNT